MQAEQLRSGWVLRMPGWEHLPAEDAWQVTNAIKFSLVEHALKRANGLLGIHAALVGDRGCRMLLAGASRAGKTTLCLELLERGWLYGSDDLAPLTADGRVLPFPRAVAVRGAALWDRFRTRWDAPGWLPAPAETFQVPARLFPSIGEGPLSATHLFFIDPDHTTVAQPETLTRALAITKLSKYVRWFEARDLAPLARLGREVSAATLRYRTPQEGADQVALACS